MFRPSTPRDSSHLLTKTLEGDWATTIHLCPGRVVYCFDVDGTAWLDPHDEGRVPNGWGSEYSTREIRQEPEASAIVHTRRKSLTLEGGIQGAVSAEKPDAIVAHPTGEVELSNGS